MEVSLPRESSEEGSEPACVGVVQREKLLELVDDGEACRGSGATGRSSRPSRGLEARNLTEPGIP
jgi:hypothetical protein